MNRATTWRTTCSLLLCCLSAVFSVGATTNQQDQQVPQSALLTKSATAVGYEVGYSQLSKTSGLDDLGLRQNTESTPAHQDRILVDSDVYEFAGWDEPHLQSRYRPGQQTTEYRYPEFELPTRRS
jgi:hypothetical protein